MFKGVSMLLASSVHASVLELSQRGIRQCSLLGSLNLHSPYTHFHSTQPVQILSHRRYQLTGRVAFKIKYTLLSSRVHRTVFAYLQAACESHTEKRDDVYQESCPAALLRLHHSAAGVTPNIKLPSLVFVCL